MERAPASFAMMDEEDHSKPVLAASEWALRGKALRARRLTRAQDGYLIRVQDKNIFVAECKFWDGEQSFQEAIDQLLGYLTWRDSKCALFIFNQNRDSQAVASKMHAVMQARTEFKKHLGPDAHGDHRYILVKPSEPGREITITTQLFDVPRSGPNLRRRAVVVRASIARRV